jgi:hypothetical protein
VVFDSHGKRNGTSSASWVHPELTYANAGHQRLAAADNSFHYWWGENGSAALILTIAIMICFLLYAMMNLDTVQIHLQSLATFHLQFLATSHGCCGGEFVLCCFL